MDELEQGKSALAWMRAQAQAYALDPSATWATTDNVFWCARILENALSRRLHRPPMRSSNRMVLIKSLSTKAGPIYVTIKVSKILKLRIRLAILVARLGCKIAGIGMQTRVEKEDTDEE